MPPFHTHEILADLIQRVHCKLGWSFEFHGVRGGEGKRLVITVDGHDSVMRSPMVPITVRHFFPIPDATYNKRAWLRWIFECCRGVENHELGEWFVVEGERPFAPLHGPGENPYLVHEFRPEVDARTVQDGSVRPA